MKRVNIVVSGNIQNVGNEARVITIAKAFGLTGFVQNLMDGGIKIIGEGEDSNLDGFLDAIMIENTLFGVANVEVKHADATGDFDDFYNFVDRADMREFSQKFDKGVVILGQMNSVVEDGFWHLNHATGKSIEQISTLRQETTKFSEDLVTMRRDLVGEVEEQISTLRQETTKFGEDLDTMRIDLVGEVGAKILNLRNERRLSFEQNMLSDMYENFKHYDSALQKTLEKSPYEKSVFIMMPFKENDIRLRAITDTIKETLEEHGLCGWRADDLERAIMEDIWDNIVVNMLSCKYGIAVFVDRTLLDRYTDEQITVFNANIALEVGFMKSRGLDVLLLKDKQLEKLPTDIISKLYEEFDFDDPEGGIKKAVTKWIKKRQSGEMHNSRRSDHFR